MPKKLGALLLRRLVRSPKRKKKSASHKLSTRSKRAGAGFFFQSSRRSTPKIFKRTRSKRWAHSTPAPIETALLTLTPVSAPEAQNRLDDHSSLAPLAQVIRLESVAAHKTQKSRGLLSADLLRPNEKLSKSIEAFLLDQRSEHTRRAYGKDLNRFVKFLISRKFERGVESLDLSLIHI